MARELTEKDKKNLQPILIQIGEKEPEWMGWYKEQVKRKTAERIAIVGRFRVFFVALEKRGVKVLGDAHVIEIKEIKSDKPSQVLLGLKKVATRSPTNLVMQDIEADEFITAVRQIFINHFFNMPSKKLKIKVEPPTRLKAVEGPTSVALAKSCGGFSGTYQAICNLYNQNVRVDICWDMDNLLPANHVKEFNMKDFEQPVTQGDLKALIDSLHYNGYFIGFVSEDYKLTNDTLKVIADMLGTNTKIEKLVLRDVDSSNFEDIGAAIESNKKTAITYLDVSHNNIQDRGIAAVGKAVQALGHGLVHLDVTNGNARKNGTVVLCNGLKSNPYNCKTLRTLNISGNKLDIDGSGALASFLSNSNVIQNLDISYCQANLDTILGAMARGTNDLISLNLSGNKLLPKCKQTLGQFLQSCGQLKHLKMSECSIQVNIVREIFKSIISNVYFSDMTVDLSGNKLGVLGANMLKGLAEEIVSISKLNLSNNEFGDDGLAILAEGLKANRSIVKLDLSDNFSKSKTAQRDAAIDNLIELITADDDEEEGLITHLSLAASNRNCAIGIDLLTFIYALATNDTLKFLDISGHYLGDKAGIALGKALQTNRSLVGLVWDRNATKLAGLKGFKVGLERNTVLKDVPLPILDIGDCLSTRGADQAKIQAAVSEISLALARNLSPKSKFQKFDGGTHSMATMGDSEEVQKLRTRINASEKKLTKQQKKTLRDAEKNDDYIESLHKIQEDMQQALQDEIASKLGGFTQELVPFLSKTRVHLIENMISNVSEKYTSFSDSFVQRVRHGLMEDAQDRPINSDVIFKILAREASVNITNEVTKSFTTSVETAIENIYDELLDRLEDIYFEREAPEEEFEEVQTGQIEDIEETEEVYEENEEHQECEEEEDAGEEEGDPDDPTNPPRTAPRKPAPQPNPKPSSLTSGRSSGGGYQPPGGFRLPGIGGDPKHHNELANALANRGGMRGGLRGRGGPGRGGPGRGGPGPGRGGPGPGGPGRGRGGPGPGMGRGGSGNGASPAKPYLPPKPAKAAPTSSSSSESLDAPKTKTTPSTPRKKKDKSKTSSGKKKKSKSKQVAEEKPKPDSTADDSSASGNIAEAPIKEGNLTHLTRDRVAGPGNRRRPQRQRQRQRRPMRRPMMEEG
eukprot:CAMPEP_0174261770 /NCGR_PEP_ID=MMETSP0439-20130205/12128_1 /TAXON_ID=0 /ORGANISM="Stereomyxa ramosa, Strain Chinc5" /LENGTH=1142 /DNA_ID=CAMNT_0015346331 /DNA_START=77 /DNA_END=3505 /DNA_ORIENTATION=+